MRNHYRLKLNYMIRHAGVFTVDLPLIWWLFVRTDNTEPPVLMLFMTPIGIRTRDHETPDPRTPDPEVLHAVMNVRALIFAPTVHTLAVRRVAEGIMKRSFDQRPAFFRRQESKAPNDSLHLIVLLPTPTPDSLHLIAYT